VSAAPELLRVPARWLAAVWSRPWIGFVAVFACALWQRWHMPWLPLATADSWGFLAPVFHEMNGEGFRQTFGRSLAYPLFLLSVLRITESFPAIAVVQHALGLLSGVAWVWVFSLWVAWLPAAVRRRPFVWWIGAFALGLYLLGAWTVMHETMLRPESIFPLFAFLQAGFTLVFLRARWNTFRPLTATLSGALAVLCAALCLSLKPSWGFAAAVPAAALLAGIIGTGRPAIRLASVSAALCGLALTGVWIKAVPPVTGWIADDAGKTFLPATLFTVHADLVSRTMHERARRGLLDEEEVDFLARLDLRLAESRKIHPQKFKLLGHDPDYLMYHSDSLRELPGDAHATADRAADYLMASYFTAVMDQPAAMAAKVWQQLLQAFGNAENSLHCASSSWRSHFENARDLFPLYQDPAVPARLTAGWDDLSRQCASLAGAEPKRRFFAPSMPPWFLRGFLTALVGFLTVGGLLIVIVPERVLGNRPARELLPAARVFSVIAAMHLGAVMTVAIVHSFDIKRYLALLSPTQSLVLGAGSALLVALLLVVWPARQKLSATDPASRL